MNLHRVIFLAGLVLLMAGSPCKAEFYKYYDENGARRYTDNLEDVPFDQRDSAIYYRDVGATSKSKSSEPPEIGPNIPGEEDENEIADARVQRLERQKADLDKEYQGLLDEKASLESDRETLVNRAYDKKQYDEKVSQLNQKILDYEKRRLAFEEEVHSVEAERQASEN